MAEEATGWGGVDMKSKPPAPADMRTMGIVHDPLRRDLARAIDALSAEPASRPDGDRSAAIGEQVSWMMDFLHAHHRGEDAWLWPLLRERVPWAARRPRRRRTTRCARPAQLSPVAARLLAIGGRCVITLAQGHRLPHLDEPMALHGIEHLDLQTVANQLAAAGLPVESTPDAAWTRPHEHRRNYAATLDRLAHRLELDPPTPSAGSRVPRESLGMQAIHAGRSSG